MLNCTHLTHCKAARLQQYVNCEFPDAHPASQKGRGTKDQIANICWIIKKAWEKHLREHSYVSETSEVSQNNHSFSTPAETLSPLSMNVNTKFVWDSTFDSTLWLWQTACFTKLGKKVMTNLDSILKSRDIPLSTKVCLVKAMVFPVVMYGCESWTIKKAERQRIDAFELWCWRRLLRVPWTSRRSNHSILKEMSP